MANHALITLASLLPLLSSLPAAAQSCVPQVVGIPTGPIPARVFDDIRVYDMVTFDDGSGPALYIAGHFGLPPMPNDPNPVTNAAKYQHGQWTPMEGGLTPTFAHHFKDLEIADFSSVGGPGPSLYAAGRMFGADQIGAVFRWNGAQWISTTFTSTGMDGSCHSLLFTTDAQGPVLLAAGDYTGEVLAWRGSGSWTPYAPLQATGSNLRLRLIDDGSGPAVFLAGSFNDASRGVSHLAKLVDGQWTDVPLPGLTSVQQISDITVFDSGIGPEVYVTGRFSTSTVTNANVARLRNGTWQIVAAGPSGGVALDNPQSSIFGPTFFKLDEGQGERLYVGGEIFSAGQYSGLLRLASSGIAWEASVYLTVPNDGFSGSAASTLAMQRFDVDGEGPIPATTFVGGNFTEFRQPGVDSTLTSTYGLIRSDAGSPFGWVSTAAGLSSAGTPSYLQQRYELSSVDIGGTPSLFAGFNFTRAGGILAKNAAVWDADHWISMPSNSQLGRAAVGTIAGQRQLVATAFQTGLRPLAIWNGASWTRMLPAVSGQAWDITEFQGSFYALTDSGLYRYTDTPTPAWTTIVASTFTNNARVLATADLGQGPRLLMGLSQPDGPGVYEFDGITLTRVGPPTTSVPQDVCVHNEGSGPTVWIASPSLTGGVQRLANGAWETPGAGITSPSRIAICSFDDGNGPALFAAGEFSSGGGLDDVGGLLQWRNGAWARVVPISPINNSGFKYATLKVHQGRLYIAGQFVNLGAVNADHFAWIEPCAPACGTSDFNADGDFGTDADIEAFFACLAGNCCETCFPLGADFNADGDTGTDADIESFFRVLAGGAC